MVSPCLSEPLCFQPLVWAGIAPFPTAASSLAEPRGIRPRVNEGVNAAAVGTFLPYFCSPELGLGLRLGREGSLGLFPASGLRSRPPRGPEGRRAPIPGQLFPVFVICIAVTPRSLCHGALGFVFHSRQLGEGEHTLLKKMRKKRKK